MKNLALKLEVIKITTSKYKNEDLKRLQETIKTLLPARGYSNEKAEKYLDGYLEEKGFCSLADIEESLE